MKSCNGQRIISGQGKVSEIVFSLYDELFSMISCRLLFLAWASFILTSTQRWLRHKLSVILQHGAREWVGRRYLHFYAWKGENIFLSTSLVGWQSQRAALVSMTTSKYLYSPLDRMLVHCRLTSPNFFYQIVLIIHQNSFIPVSEERHCDWEYSVLPENSTQCYREGFTAPRRWKL